MTRRAARAVLAAGFVLMIGGLAGCRSNGPTPNEVSDSFTGVLAPLGTNSHNFTITLTSFSDASITIDTLTSVATGAAQTITVGVGFGNLNTGTCARLAGLTNTAAPINVELATTGLPFAAGTFCVQIFDNPDAPTVTEPLNYKLTVRHY